MNYTKNYDTNDHNSNANNNCIPIIIEICIIIIHFVTVIRPIIISIIMEMIRVLIEVIEIMRIIIISFFTHAVSLIF